MSNVFSALATSADGYITGRDPRPGQGLGAGGVLFDWYGDPRNSSYYQALSDRVGAVVTGRTTYDDSEAFDGGSPHPHRTDGGRQPPTAAGGARRLRPAVLRRLD